MPVNDLQNLLTQLKEQTISYIGSDPRNAKEGMEQFCLNMALLSGHIASHKFHFQSQSYVKLLTGDAV